MDTTYLYRRQRDELMRAESAESALSRIRHRELAALYGAIINGAVARGDDRTGPN